MTETHYERLSHLDSSFLALETPTTHMHVGGVALFRLGDLDDGSGGLDFERIKDHVGSKLHYLPRYRQRLAFVPYDGSPVWVDDENFSLDYHVRHSSLPHPGTDDQLRDLAGRVTSVALDRAKPLWELWFVEGLVDERFAVIAKIHHSMIDGISGVDLTTILLGVAPTGEIEEAPNWGARPAPTPVELAISVTTDRTKNAVEKVASVTEMVREGREIAESFGHRAVASLASLRSGWLEPSSATPLNPDLGPNRRFSWTSMPLQRIKDLRTELGGSINDHVLAITAGGVRHFLLKDRGYDVDNAEFRVMNPVSVRPSSQRGRMGNQVAMWLVDLPVSEPDPVKRLELIMERTIRLKKTDQALGASTIVELSRGTPLTLLSMANRVVGPRLRPFNMTVTNVPGPQFPMYLLGSEMLGNYPVVPLWIQHGVGVALFSYNGDVDWGIHADYDSFPDIENFVESLHVGIDQLEAATS
ncbi:MAG: wax ester/triacylglycerol synthase family O-acyltransferase [Acidimicrobiia bacterium]|nr:wax ester/triacylglycerol synthase family O-acyltransferase [Acidimicrobiia bacterium]